MEVSRKFLEMNDPFGRIAEIESYANGEPVTSLTILSKESQNLNSFGGLLDEGVQQLEVVYEPGTPLGSDAGEDEIQGVDVVGDDQQDHGIQGRDVPEFQQLEPVLREDEVSDKRLSYCQTALFAWRFEFGQKCLPKSKSIFGV